MVCYTTDIKLQTQPKEHQKLDRYGKVKINLATTFTSTYRVVVVDNREYGNAFLTFYRRLK